MTPILELGLVAALFGAIFSVYQYAHKCSTETNQRVQAVEDCVEGELAAVQKSVTDMNLSLTNRLTALETKLDSALQQKQRA